MKLDETRKKKKKKKKLTYIDEIMCLCALLEYYWRTAHLLDRTKETGKKNIQRTEERKQEDFFFFFDVIVALRHDAFTCSTWNVVIEWQDVHNEKNHNIKYRNVSILR